MKEREELFPGDWTCYETAYEKQFYYYKNIIRNANKMLRKLNKEKDLRKFDDAHCDPDCPFYFYHSSGGGIGSSSECKLYVQGLMGRSYRCKSDKR